ncbi:unnamed protein product, partial [marine sediment metagenome]
MVTGVVIGNTLSPALTPLMNATKQLAYSIWPNELLPAVEIIEARYRG